MRVAKGRLCSKREVVSTQTPIHRVARYVPTVRAWATSVRIGTACWASDSSCSIRLLLEILLGNLGSIAQLRHCRAASGEARSAPGPRAPESLLFTTHSASRRVFTRQRGGSWPFKPTPGVSPSQFLEKAGLLRGAVDGAAAVAAAGGRPPIILALDVVRRQDFVAPGRRSKLVRPAAEPARAAAAAERRSKGGGRRSAAEAEGVWGAGLGEGRHSFAPEPEERFTQAGGEYCGRGRESMSKEGPCLPLRLEQERRGTHRGRRSTQRRRRPKRPTRVAVRHPSRWELVGKRVDARGCNPTMFA